MADFEEHRKGGAGRDHGLDWNTERFEQLRNSLVTDNVEELQSSLQSIHRLLEANKKRNENITKLIDGKVAEAVVSLLQREEPDVLALALAIIGFIASGTPAQASFIVSLAVLPVLVKEAQLPASGFTHTKVQEAAIWALGKISERSVPLRDQVVDAGGFQAILSTIVHRLSDLPSSQVLGRKAAFALGTFFGRKPPLNAQFLPATVMALSVLLDTHDEETTVLACRCISAIAEGPILPNINVLLESTEAAIPEKLMRGLSASSNESIQSASLRAIGSILTGTTQHTQVFLDLQLLPALYPFLSHPKKAIRREVVWVISNITAEPNHQQVQMVLNTPELLPTLVTLLNTDPEIEVRQEAIWALSNIANSSNDVHVLSVLHAGFLSAIAELLNNPSMGKLFPIALEALEKMLCTARDNDGQWAMIEPMLVSSHVEEKLEALLSHRHATVVEYANALLGDFFGRDVVDDENDEEISPEAQGREA